MKLKIAVTILLLVFAANALVVPAPSFAASQQNNATGQNSKGEGSWSAAPLIPFLALGAIAAAICIAGSLSIWGFSGGGPFKCSITNPPGWDLLSSDGLSKWIIKPAARIIIRALLQATTQQIVSWIQGGGGQNVGYVQNFDQALRNEANLAGGEFLNNLTGMNLCGNIGAFLNLTLRTPGFRQRITCSVSNIISNLNNFYANFTQGGWPAFIKISFEPQNSLGGAYLIALDAKIDAETNARGRVGAGLSAGKGFLGFRVPKQKCTPIDPSELDFVDQNTPGVWQDDSGNLVNCTTEYDTKTPGELIAEGLNKASFAGIDFAVNAKDFDEAIATIINALIAKLISSTTNGGQGIFNSELSHIPTETSNGSSMFSSQAASLVYTADSAFSATNKMLSDGYRALFALQSSPSSPSDTTKAQQISYYKDLAPQLIKSRNDLLDAKGPALDLKTALETTTDPQQLVQLAQQIPIINARILGAAPAGIGSPYTPTGDPHSDSVALIQGVIDDINSTVAVEDSLLDTFARITTATSTPASTSFAEVEGPLRASKQALLARAAELTLAKQQVTNTVSSSFILSSNALILSANVPIQAGFDAIERFYGSQ